MSARSGGLVRAGFDEAGLGPTLGPLVVAGFATAGTRGGDWGPCDDLRGPLAKLVGEPGCRDGRIEVGDSKKIHLGPRKLARVERTALATVTWVHGRTPQTVGELLDLVATPSFESDGDRRAPWWSTLDERLPIECERAEIEQLGDDLGKLARKVKIRPLWYRADVISAARINREIAIEHRREGTKNTWATHTVLRLAKLAVDQLDASQLAIWCDKAGGRSAYTEPLRRAFPELSAAAAHDMPLFGSPAIMLERLGEQSERSCYRMSSAARRIELGFVMGGDICDPRISWASILAKYLRELIMRSLNRHFAARVPELRPTAGYPEDARRFIAEVEAALGENGGLERAAWIRSL
ncbi:MAG TPA: hypothetical protein VM869_17925 [Enhygromyxa sp.]|nr:hypothetical protein [Enhygromyxa sp.]